MLAVALLVVQPAVAPADAAPPPEPVCGVCDVPFDRAVADAGGPDVNVSRSTLDVYVRENGSARFVVRNRLRGDGTAWVHNNTGAVAEDLTYSEHGLVTDRTDLAVRMVEDVAVVTFTVRDFARDGFGDVLLVDAFRETDSTGWEVNAREFALHAPDGWTFTAGPEPGDGGTATWTGRESVDDDFVAFAPDDGLVPTAATQVTVVVETGPQFLVNAALALAVPLVLLAGVFHGFRSVVDAVGAPEDASRLGAAVAVLGGVVTVALVASGSVSTYFVVYATAPLFAAVTAVVVGGLAAAGRLRTDRRLAAAAVGTPLLLGAISAVVGANAQPAVGLRTVGRALAGGLLAAQAWLFAAVAADWRGVTAGWWRVLGTLVAPLVGVVALLGPAALLSPIAATWFLLLFAAGLPAYLLGAAVGPRLRSV